MSDTPQGQIIFDDAVWRALIPAFKNPLEFPTAIMEIFFNNACSFIDSFDSAVLGYGVFTGAARLLGLYLMASHLYASTTMIANNEGMPLGIVTMGVVKDVRVEIKPPPEISMFSFWLSTTPYGQQLYAMLTVQSAGGFYIGGSDQRSAFRGTYGLRRGYGRR